MSHALRKLLTLPKASGLLYLFLIFGNNCEVNKRRRDTKLITRCFVTNEDLSSDIALIKLDMIPNDFKDVLVMYSVRFAP